MDIPKEERHSHLAYPMEALPNMTDYLRALLARLRGLLGIRKADVEFADEIQAHLDLLTERYIRQGMTRDEAAATARRQFGNVTMLKEANREMRGMRFIETLIQDVRYGLWMLSRNPGFTFVAVLTLALGIGANTAIFSVVNAALLRPLPYQESQRLVWISKVDGGDEGQDPPVYLEWRSESKTLDYLAAFNLESTFLTGRGRPEQLDSISATVDLFQALSVAPRLGRAFSPEECRPGGARVVILSHDFWQRRFGGDLAIIGQSLTIEGESRMVIGVMPAGFKLGHRTDVWLPLVIKTQPGLKSYEMGVTANLIGRLKPGVSIEQARSELDSILRRRLEKTDPDLLSEIQVRVIPLGEKLVGHLRQGLLVLFGAVAFVLLIACANVANLMLARGARRQREMAIRAAIGAGRWRLVRQMLTESLLLSAFGGAAGLLLALAGVKALVAFAPNDLAQVKKSGIDGMALGFTFLASLLTGVAAGIIPALQTSRIDLNESLKEGARGGAFSNRKGAQRVSPALVIGEWALTLALLAGAGLLIKSFLRLCAVEPGYDPRNLLTMMIPLDFTKYPPGSAQQRRFYQELLARLNTLPGVKAAALGPLPLAGKKRTVGSPSGSNSSIPPSSQNDISPNYFQAMGMRLLAGRGLTERDALGARAVLVISETMARRRFPGENPIGKHLKFPNTWDQTIVGVVGDVKRYGLESEANSQCYHSILQCPKMYREIDLMIRTAGDPMEWASAVREQIWALDPDQPIGNVMSMEQRLAESVAMRRFQMVLFGCFAGLALIIATVGIYGIISYSVSQRTHEIGIRMALGAQSIDVLWMVISRGLSLALIGVTLGLVAALALTRVMKNLLFEVNPTDPVTFTLIALLLVVIAVIASYIPARRATKVDPLQTIRHD
jgi:putative ABC transport system permease protein